MTRLAFGAGSLHTYGLNRVWDFAADAGFDAVEVMVDAKWDTRQPAYLRSLVTATGLPIAAIHTPFRPLAGFGDDYPACVRRALTLAGEVGAETVVAHPELADGTDYSPWLMHHYEELIAPGGPVLAIENLPLVLSNRRPKYRTHTVELTARFPAVAFDTTHFGSAGVDIVGAFGVLRDRVQHVHLSDYGGGREHLVVGQGDLPLDLFLLALHEANYDRVLTVELAPESLDAGDDAAIRAHLAATVAFCREHWVGQTSR